MGKRGRPRTRGPMPLKLPFQILDFLKSLKCGERTAFIEQLIEASSQYRAWQKTRG